MAEPGRANRPRPAASQLEIARAAKASPKLNTAASRCIIMLIALRAVDENWLKAAAGLGGSPWTVFRTITLPNITPGIVGGAIFSFITSFDEVVMAVFLAGYSNKTLPVKIWESIRLEFTPVIAVAATMMMVLAFVLFAAAQLASSDRETPTR